MVEHHPVIVAAKTHRASLSGNPWRASIQGQPVEPVVRGTAVAMSVTATNTGTTTWRARSASGIGHVSLGVQLLDAEERLVARDYHRVVLPHDVAPGQTVRLSFECPAPGEPGRYRMKRDFVAEGVTWFETVGSVPDTILIEVR